MQIYKRYIHVGKQILKINSLLIVASFKAYKTILHVKQWAI